MKKKGKGGSAKGKPNLVRMGANEPHQQEKVSLKRVKRLIRIA